MNIVTLKTYTLNLAIAYYRLPYLAIVHMNYWLYLVHVVS